MSGKMDKVKGRTKEAVGVLVGDKRLEREGKVERAAGDIKEKAGKLADDVKKKTEKVVDKVKSAIKR
ncbi:MAG TPA: CsbD family protein [Myxococcota bacterium]|nr:CsbD family protein [Myxococcota bacterium]